MKYTFNVETKRNVNVVGDYSVISYSAEYIGAEPLVRSRFSGTVRVSPHDADPDEEITRDLAEQIRNLYLRTDGAATLEVEV